MGASSAAHNQFIGAINYLARRRYNRKGAKFSRGGARRVRSRRDIIPRPALNQVLEPRIEKPKAEFTDADISFDKVKRISTRCFL
jgi:hypothetical protein